MTEETAEKLWGMSLLKKKDFRCIECGALFGSLVCLAKDKCRRCEEREELVRDFDFLLGARIEKFYFDADVSHMELKCTRLLVSTKHDGAKVLLFEDARQGIFIVEDYQGYAYGTWCKTEELRKKFMVLRDAKIEKFCVVQSVFSSKCRALIVSTVSEVLFEFEIDWLNGGLIAREICYEEEK